MSLTKKQRRFAEEYSVDHNGRQAAIRAGYAEGQAASQASRMLKNVAVKQMVIRLDADKSGDLALEGAEVLREIDEEYRTAALLQPKIWKGEPVTYVDEDGVTQVVLEYRSPAVVNKMLELKARYSDLEASRSTLEVSHVVYTLSLDRDLSDE